MTTPHPTTEAGPTPVGLTRDVGYEIGVSRTINLPRQQVWDHLTSADGIARWLGQGLELPASKGTRSETPDGTTGEVRSYHSTGRIRFTWQPAGWDHSTTMQVTATASGDKTVLRFHQEKLADPGEREQQRQHWQAVMDAVVADLA